MLPAPFTPFPSANQVHSFMKSLSSHLSPFNQVTAHVLPRLGRPSHFLNCLLSKVLHFNEVILVIFSLWWGFLRPQESLPNGVLAHSFSFLQRADSSSSHTEVFDPSCDEGRLLSLSDARGAENFLTKLLWHRCLLKAHDAVVLLWLCRKS